jgi:hypothetical protein
VVLLLRVVRALLERAGGLQGEGQQQQQQHQQYHQQEEGEGGLVVEGQLGPGVAGAGSAALPRVARGALQQIGVRAWRRRMRWRSS